MSYINREAALAIFNDLAMHMIDDPKTNDEIMAFNDGVRAYFNKLNELPEVNDMISAWEASGWLLAYHTQSFKLNGRYLPHKVIGWLISDFMRKFVFPDEEEEEVNGGTD